MSKRRGSRLFSGQPGLLLVSEDIPASKALAIMNEKKITSLLVYSSNNKKKLKGIVHIHYILFLGVKINIQVNLPVCMQKYIS